MLTRSTFHYLIVTINYWAFTLSDGALRMLVLLYFYELGYNTLSIASLFLFYEMFGVITNLVGGLVGARLGLNRTMQIGTLLQIAALCMLLAPANWIIVPWVMASQALSGIAKDLNKMSAKSAIKWLVVDDQHDRLYRWVAVLTGSKNTLKGAGFFLGGLLMSWFGFDSAIIVLVLIVACGFVVCVIFLPNDLGQMKRKPKFKDIFSKSASINLLSSARLFLFASRDVWFVIALPVFLTQSYHLDHWQVGALLASWIIFYGLIQGLTPWLTGKKINASLSKLWLSILLIPPGLLAIFLPDISLFTLVIFLVCYAFCFAINSAIHSYLIVSLASRESVSMDVGFYYMANATGRLLGTIASGWFYLHYGISACLWVSAFMVLASVIASLPIPSSNTSTAT